MDWLRIPDLGWVAELDANTWVLSVTCLTLVLLVAQEMRLRRERPKPFLVVRQLGTATFTEGDSSETWNTFELTNAGQGMLAFQFLHTIGAERKYLDGFIVRAVLLPGETNRILVGEGFEEAWIRFMWIDPYRRWGVMEWRALMRGSRLQEEMFAQAAEQTGSRFHPRRIRRILSGGAPHYVGPGGRTELRLGLRARKKGKRIERGLAHPDTEGMLLPADSL